MNHCGKITKAIVLSITILLGLSVATKSAMSATAPVVSNLTSVVDGASTPIRILADPSGNYYVSDPRGGGVLKYNRNGKLLLVFKTVRDASGLAFAQNGELLVTHGTTVARLDINTGNIIGTFGTFSRAQGIAVDVSGAVYVTDSVNDCVQKFDSSYNPVPIATHNAAKPVNSFGTTGLSIGQFKRPSGITYEKVSGQLAVADSLNGRIQFFSQAGTPTGTLGSFGSGPLKFTMPKGIVFEYQGTPAAVSRYYVVDSFQSNVQVIDATTNAFLGYVGEYGYAQGNLVSPSDVQIDQTNPLSPVLIVANEIGLLTRYGIDSLQPTDVMVLPATVPGQLTLTWTNPQIPSFAYVHVYRSTTPGVLGTLVGGNITAATYTDSPLAANTTYYYTVRGVNNTPVELASTEQVSGQTLTAFQVAVAQTGLGGGTIGSNLPLPGLVFSNGTYAASVNGGTTVTLTPYHDAYSVFTGWAGDVCNNQSTADCTFVMNGNVNVTANFDKQHLFKIAGRGVYDDILQNIYNQALAGETIMAMSGVAPAYDTGLFLNMTAGTGNSVTVVGGYDADYQTATGVTTLQGRVNLKAGKVVFKNIKIK